MRKIFSYVVIFILVSIMFFNINVTNAEASDLSSVSSQQYKKAYRYNVQGWIYLYVEGEPYERGYQHGYLLAPEIVDTIVRWSSIIHNHPKLKSLIGDVNSPNYEKVSQKWWDYCKSSITKMYWDIYPEEYKQEIMGIADGAASNGGKVFGEKITYQDILAINEMYEFMTKLENQKESFHPLRTFASSLRQVISGLPTDFEDTFISSLQDLPKAHHCSGFIATGDATSQGQIVATHITQCGGWWYPYYIPQRWNVILDVAPTDGYRFQMTTSPGFIWSDENYYQNNKGIIVIDTTAPQGLWSKKGLPFAIRTRKAAQYSSSIDDAINYLKTQNDGIWTTVLLFGDTKTGEIARLDLGLYKSGLWRTKNGYYYAANNILDKATRFEANGFGWAGIIAKLKKQSYYVYYTLKYYPNTREIKFDELAKEFYGKIDIDVVKKMATTKPIVSGVTFDCKISDTNLIKENGLWCSLGYLSGNVWNLSAFKNVFKDVKDGPPTGWVQVYGLPSDFNHKLIRQSDNKLDGGEKVLWTVKTNKENYLEYSQSTATDGVVYSTTSSGMIYAIKAENGSVIWEKEIGGNNTVAPLVYRDLVFTGSDRLIYALDRNGDTKWVNVIDPIVSQPVANGDMIIIGSKKGVYGFSYDSGDEIWNYPTESPAYVSKPWNDLIFVGSGKECYAINCNDGQVKWTFEVDAPITSAPLVNNGIVYLGCWDGYLYKLDANDGDLIWQYGTGWGIDATPTVKDNTVFFGSMDNNVYAVDIETRETKWIFTAQASIHSSPVVYGDYVFFGSDDGRLYALNKTSGEQVWSFSPGYKLENDVYNFATTPILSDPVVEDGRIIIGAKGDIFALETQTSEPEEGTIAESEIPMETWFFIIVLVLIIIVIISACVYLTRKAK